MTKRIRSTIGARGRITVPKAVRERLGISQSDPIYWEMDEKGVRVTGKEPAFFKYFGSIKTGPGSVSADIRRARRMRGRERVR